MKIKLFFLTFFCGTYLNTLCQTIYFNKWEKQNVTFDFVNYSNLKIQIDENLKKIGFGSIVRKKYDYVIEYKNNTSFRQTKFLKPIYFTGAKFYKNVDFTFSNFNGYVDFEEVEFINQANYNSSYFSEETNFGFAKFRKETDFSYATFKKKALFSGTIFNSSVNFSYSTFEQTPDFYFTQLPDTVILKNTKLNSLTEPIRFDLASVDSLQKKYGINRKCKLFLEDV